MRFPSSLATSLARTLGCVAASLLSLALLSCDDAQTSATTRSQGGADGSQRRLTVGFSQIGAESAWRTANTQSIQDEAAKRSIELQFSDAQGKQENQIRAIRSFIAQQVSVIVVAPVIETGWEPVLIEAREAGIPVILSDRSVRVSDPNLITAQIGFDSVEEGRRAASWAVEATGGNAVIAELQGTPGSAPALERKRGFDEGIAAHPGMRIVKTQTGNFERGKGREVMEAFLMSPEGPSITLVYAHNDDMALGAIQAIEAAGKRPGIDIKIVSIDGIRDAFVAMTQGTLNCTVECNPMIGPPLFDLVERVADGRPFERRNLVPPRVFAQADAAAALPERRY